MAESFCRIALASSRVDPGQSGDSHIDVSQHFGRLGTRLVALLLPRNLAVTVSRTNALAARTRYAGIELSEALRGLEGEASDLDRCVVLTFDDGFYDFLTHAWPVLDELSFTATVFLPTAYIGDSRKQFKGQSAEPQAVAPLGSRS